MNIRNEDEKQDPREVFPEGDGFTAQELEEYLRLGQTPEEKAEDLRAPWTRIPTPPGDPAFRALWDEHRRTCLERKREAQEHEVMRADWMMREIMLTAENRRRQREALGAEVIAGLEAALIVGVGIGYWLLH